DFADHQAAAWRRCTEIVIRSSLHSKLTGDSATCGGRTTWEGRVVSFASANSSTEGSYSPLVRFMASATAKVTTLTTNSPVSRMFRNVSLGADWPSTWRSDGEKPRSGGFADIALKKEKAPDSGAHH